jgi:hypothetical protein
LGADELRGEARVGVDEGSGVVGLDHAVGRDGDEIADHDRGRGARGDNKELLAII